MERVSFGIMNRMMGMCMWVCYMCMMFCMSLSDRFSVLEGKHCAA